MIIKTKDNRPVFLRPLDSGDLERLLHYLQQLSPETKRRFGPHPFDKQSVIDFYDDPHLHKGYVAQAMDTHEIVAYSIIKMSYLEGDYHRFLSYGIQLNNGTDGAFAPSVADAWQSCGIGDKLFHFILEALKTTDLKRLVLWGGVQADNVRAVNYYQKNGFQWMGRFTYNGENFDMMLNMG